MNLFCIFARSKSNIMKKLRALLPVLFGIVVLLSSCDKIEPPYYYMQFDEDVTVEFPPLDESKVYRKLYMEEFTGHRCVNCPAGHEVIEQLKNQYGDTLVVVGIHYGTLAKPQSSGLYTYDFRTAEGNTLGEYFNIDAIPSAIINRGYELGGWQRDEWANVLRNQSREVSAALQLINEYDPELQTVKANVKVTALKRSNVPYNLILFLIEDGVVKPQKNGTENIEDYVHNHVLRATFNQQPMGMQLNDGAVLEPGSSCVYASTLDMSNTDWVPGNCSVVAVLYDYELHEVLQAESLPVISR